MVDKSVIIEDLISCLVVNEDFEGLSTFINNWEQYELDCNVIPDFLESRDSTILIGPSVSTKLYHIIEELLPVSNEGFSRFIIDFIYNLSLISPINKQRLFSEELTQILIDSIEETPSQLAKNLLMSLIELGLNCDQFSQLYKLSSKNDYVLDMILNYCNIYPSVHKSIFLTNDAHLDFNSLTMSDISRGFTVQSWFKLNSGFNNMHQSTNIEFKFLAITNDKHETIVQYNFIGHKLVVETMNTSSKYFEAQTFESFTFELGKIYNIALNHKYENKRNAKVDLFVNGEFVQSLKINYPFFYLTETNNLSSVFHSKLLLQNNTHKVVKVNLTLQGPSSFDSVIPEIINILLLSTVPSLEWLLTSYHLGPDYAENYQDRNLGKFLNHKARLSMSLMLQEGIDLLSVDSDVKKLKGLKMETGDNEIMRMSKMNVSPFSIALNCHASNAEIIDSKMILNYRNSNQNKPSQSIEISDNGIIYWNPRLITDLLNAIGGFAIPLRFVELSKTTDILVRSLDMLFYVLSNDWRSLDEFESKAGYDILATILKTKKQLINLEVLDSVLRFVGFNHSSPIDSILVNPDAYKSLIADFEVWKPEIVDGLLDSSSKDTFKFVLYQFTVFGLASKYHTYNSKQLAKMKIIKRFIQALKYELFDADILPILHDSLLVLIKSNPTTEVMRSLSLYIIYALNKGNVKSNLQRECGIQALDILVNVICDSSSSMNGQCHKKILKTITIRWNLLLLGDNDSRVIKLALRFLIKALTLQGSKNYITFMETIGIGVLTECLQRWCYDSEVLIIIFSAVFGITHATEFGSDFGNWVQRLSTRGSRLTLIMPQFLLIFNNIVKFAIKNLRESVDSGIFSETSEEGLNTLMLLNSFINAMTISYENINCLNTYFSSDIKWIENIILISLQLKNLALISDHHRFEEIASQYSNFVASIFINKMFNLDYPNRMKYMSFIEAVYSHMHIGFTIVVMPVIMDHLKNFEALLPSLLENSTFSVTLFKLLSKLLEADKRFRFDDSDYNQMLDCMCMVINSVDSGSYPIKSQPIFKNSKKDFAEVFVRFFIRCTEGDMKTEPQQLTENMKLCCTTLMVNQVLILSILSNENVVILISLLFKSITSTDQELSSLASNCLRVLAMNKVNINACASILSKDHKVRDKFIKAMEGSMSMDDAEFKSELCSDLDLKHAFEQRISKCRSWLTTSEHVLNKKQVIDEILTKHLGNDSEKIKKMYKKDVTPLIAAIVNAETKKFNRHIQDDKDDLNYYITLYNSIKFNLPIENFKQSWFLDSTEGPNRMRKRIVREVEISHKASDIPIDSSLKEMEAEYTGLDEENYELLLSEQQQDDVDTLQEDKNRKILRSLFIGDKIVQILNVTQILGLETCESALIIGISHLYLAGYYFHTSMGEIVDIDDAPEDERDPYVKVISGNDKQKEGEKTTHTHETKTWEISNLLSISKRNFLLRDVALEFFFVDGTSFLITCLNKSIRDSLFSQLSSKITAKYTDEDLAEALKLASQQAASHKSGAVSSTSPFGAKLFSAIVSSASTSNLVYSSLTKKWRRGELSNFYYLILLNTLAGRTFNDLTQYPVFPFVIADYESDELDLENPATFRDLSKPMGAQTLKRANQFKERFQASAEMSPDTPPFHYGTHYSSAMIVTSYLIRLKPFVKSYLLLQGGKFDHADRTFYSIAKTWYSASRDHTTDVRELIPEFYYLPEFLVNSNNFEFGNLQDGNKVSDVILPPWAKGDPLIFVSKMRQALESDYVSKHLHEWIDLVFGFKQRGEKAIESLNLFHHLSYHGSTDLDKIKDQHEKSVIVSVIHNFGQTPLQIFNTAHPEKQNFDKLKFDSSKLLNLPLSVIETNIQIDHIEFDYEKNEWIPFDRFNRVLSNGVNKNISVQIVSNRNLIVNGVLFEDFNKCKITKVEILTNKLFLVGFQDGTIQVLKIQTDRLSELKNSQRSYLSQSQWPLKLVTNVENIKNSNHDVMVSSTIQSPISPSPASFSMFTSSSSSSSMMTPFDLVKQSIFRGHSSSIISIKHALKYKSVLTLSSNGDVKLWDLLTGTLIRDIDNDCKLISISKNLGLIVTVKNVKNMISVFTINGYSIIKHDYDYDYADDITTIEFSEFSEIGDCSGGGGGGLELSSLKISKNLNIPWCNYANLAIGTNEGSMKLYELKLSKSWELIELRKFDQVTVGVSDPVSTESSKSNNNSNDVKITSIKFNLSVELNGNGNRIGRGELIVGDSSGRLMIWR